MFSCFETFVDKYLKLRDLKNFYAFYFSWFHGSHSSAFKSDESQSRPLKHFAKQTTYKIHGSFQKLALNAVLFINDNPLPDQSNSGTPLRLEQHALSFLDTSGKRKPFARY